MKRLLGHVELKLYIVIDAEASIIGHYFKEEDAQFCASSSILPASVHLLEGDIFSVSEVFEISEDGEYIINRLELGDA